MLHRSDEPTPFDKGYEARKLLVEDNKMTSCPYCDIEYGTHHGSNPDCRDWNRGLYAYDTKNPHI